jgi:hypothetical protein
MAKSELSKFVAATVAFITGDTNTAVALKNERLGRASIKGQLSALEGSLVNAEVDLETAKENFEKAIYPTVFINNQQQYYQNIVKAQQSLDYAQDNLDDILVSINYATNLLNEKF